MSRTTKRFMVMVIFSTGTNVNFSRKLCLPEKTSENCYLILTVTFLKLVRYQEVWGALMINFHILFLACFMICKWLSRSFFCDIWTCVVTCHANCIMKSKTSFFFYFLERAHNDVQLSAVKHNNLSFHFMQVKKTSNEQCLSLATSCVTNCTNDC